MFTLLADLAVVLLTIPFKLAKCATNVEKQAVANARSVKATTDAANNAVVVVAPNNYMALVSANVAAHSTEHKDEAATLLKKGR